MMPQLQGTRVQPLLETLTPFLVVTPYNRPYMNTSPFGVTIPEENIFDPTQVGSEIFLDLLQTMDALTFGPEGMPMARWVFYDASELPGGIYGFGMNAGDIPESVRAEYEIPSDYTGLVPFSMYIAIPTPENGTWFGHNLASLNPVFPTLGLKSLGTVTKAIALRTFQAEVQVGATQWDSEALFIHTRFGPLDLETAYTPAHSEIITLTYVVPCTESAILGALGDSEHQIQRPEPHWWMRADDQERMRILQQRIEAGDRFTIPHKPRVVDDGTTLEVPVHEYGA